MVSLQPFKFEDLWEVNRINIDPWTETFSTSFYLYYMNKAPAMNWMISNNSNEKVGYIIGSTKRHEQNMRAHVIAVTVAEDARRLGLATTLMNIVETTCENQYKGLCVGLYVRPTNYHAHELYKKMGYILYRVISGYYTTIGEDGWDMRKSMKWDKDKKFMIPLDHPVPSEEAESDDDDDN